MILIFLNSESTFVPHKNFIERKFINCDDNGLQFHVGSDFTM